MAVIILTLISVLFMLSFVGYDSLTIVNFQWYQENKSKYHSSNSSYDHIISSYLSILKNMVHSDYYNKMESPLDKSETIIKQECKIASEDDLNHLTRDEYISRFFAYPTIPSNHCSQTNAEQLYNYPSFDPIELSLDPKYNEHLKFIQKLKYLVVSYHGGTDIDTISYLHDILEIPKENVANICSGTYCTIHSKTGFIPAMFKHYYDYLNINQSKIYDEIINADDILGGCCWHKAYSYWHKTEHINRIHSRINSLIDYPKLNDTAIVDVIICDFPSSQCAFLLPFAKVFIIRFMHRFNHHTWAQGQEKWGRIIHSMSRHCGDKNIILTTSNAYDWFYTLTATNVNPSNLYLWPNFARHYVDDHGHEIDESGHGYGFKFIFHAMLRPNCNESFDINKVSKMLENDYDIELIKDKEVYGAMLYNSTALKYDIGGIIAIPHSVHGAKWIEFYSIGVQLFIPSYDLWLKMNRKCQVVGHRQAGNNPHLGHIHTFMSHMEYMKYGPCGGHDPFGEKYQDLWLLFSDYYMNKYLFKYVIHFDDEKDLINKMMEYYKLTSEEKLARKQRQIEEFSMLSQRFKPHLVNAIYTAYEHADSECNLRINDLVKCIIEIPYEW